MFRKVVLPVCLIMIAQSMAWAKFGEIRGRIVQKDNLLPLAGVNVEIQDTTMGAATDMDGYYKIEKIPVGIYTLKFTYVGFETQIIPNITVKTNKPAYVNAELSVQAIESEAITVTTGYFEQPDDAPVSVQSLSYEEVRRSAGSSEDVSRMLQNFAGVNLTADDRNDLVIRGGSPTEVLYTIDHIEIPNPNHFGTQGATGGPITMINNEFIDHVQFMSGAFNATYGHKLSGSMDIQMREGDRSRYNGKINLGVDGAGGFVEGPLNSGKGSFLIGVHRSYLDLFEDMYSYGGVPVYSNAQGKFVYDFSNNQQLSFLFIGGDDYIEMEHEVDKDDYPIGQRDTVTYSDIDFKSRQYTVGGTLRSIWTDNFYTYLIASHSYNRFYTDVNQVDVAGLHVDGKKKIQNKDEVLENGSYDNTSVEQVSTIKLKTNWNAHKNSLITFGIYSNFNQFNHDIKYNPTHLEEVNYYGQTPTPFVVNVEQEPVAKYGSFLNLKQRLMDRLVVNIGGRYDYYNLIKEGNFSPRLNIAYTISERLDIHAGTGRYFQDPEFIWITSDPSNKKNLKEFGCDHYITGFNYLINPSTQLSVEVYHKEYFDYPVVTDSGYSMISMANMGDAYGNNSDYNKLVSEGKGKASGIDLMIHKKLTDKFYGLLSFSYSEIKHSALDGKYRPGAFDNKYVFNIIGGYRLSKAWEFSARWRYAGGRPYTPYDRDISITSGTGQLDLTRINEKRYKPYHRLDLRMDHRTFYKWGTWIEYITIDNAYNRDNDLYVYWNKAQQKTEFASQLGMFIAGGFSLEF
jgi:hypothetical protein